MVHNTRLLWGDTIVMLQPNLTLNLTQVQLELGVTKKLVGPWPHPINIDMYRRVKKKKKNLNI
jgi:hypothetical protein